MVSSLDGIVIVFRGTRLPPKPIPEQSTPENSGKNGRAVHAYFEDR